jgi:transposase
MTTACAAGVDVGRDYFDVGVAPSGGGFRALSNSEGVISVVTRLRRAGVRRVVLESIGGYSARLVRALAEAGFEVGVGDPKRIRALRLAEGKRAKTDRLDAQLARRTASCSRWTRPRPRPRPEVGWGRAGSGPCAGSRSGARTVDGARLSFSLCSHVRA